MTACHCHIVTAQATQNADGAVAAFFNRCPSESEAPPGVAPTAACQGAGGRMVGSAKDLVGLQLDVAEDGITITMSGPSDVWPVGMPLLLKRRLIGLVDCLCLCF